MSFSIWSLIENNTFNKLKYNDETILWLPGIGAVRGLKYGMWNNV